MNTTYSAAVAKLQSLTPGTPEHAEAWREVEAIKNQNGGMPPKRYWVNLGIDFIAADGHRYQSTQLVRDGKAVGTMEFKDGACYHSLVIDGLEREWAVYFVDESLSVIKAKATP